MNPAAPTRGERSAKRRRGLVIGGVLAVALVGGLVLLGMLPAGDRAGTVTTSESNSADASPSPSASAEVTDTLTTTCSSGTLDIPEDLDFSSTDLTGCDLSGMDFSGANLTGANLTGADLTDSALNGVVSGGIIQANKTLGLPNG